MGGWSATSVPGCQTGRGQRQTEYFRTDYSSSFAGKGSEQLAEVQALGNWFEKVTTRLCTPFLSAADISHILQGSDLWMDSDEIRRRLLRLKPAKPAVRKKAGAKKPAAKEGGKVEKKE